MGLRQSKPRGGLGPWPIQWPTKPNGSQPQEHQKESILDLCLLVALILAFYFFSHSVLCSLPLSLRQFFSLWWGSVRIQYAFASSVGAKGRILHLPLYSWIGPLV